MPTEPVQFAHSEAAARNQEPILDVLRTLISSTRSCCVLEIGSGTGQHAIRFVEALPQVVWYTSDLIQNHASIAQNIAAVNLPRLLGPLEANAQTLTQLDLQPDLIYTANTCHIMSWQNVQHMIKNVGTKLKPGGRWVIYGPFNVGGQHTAESNYRFDQYLSQSNPQQGIRHREEVVWLADQHGMSLTQCVSMPANNMMLVLERRAKDF